MEEILTNTNEPGRINFGREGFKIGLINALVALLIMFGSYFLGLNTFISTQVIAAFIPYMIIVLIIYGLQLRRNNGGFLTFKEALKFCFMSYVVVTIMMAIGNYVLYNIIDKDLTVKSFDAMKDFMRSVGMPEDQIDKMGETAKETSLKNIVLGAGGDLIWHFIKSLLVALIIRRERPVF